MWNPALGLLLVISLGVSVVDAWKAESSAIATVTPCPSASATSTPAPITVTAQYQPVSTCEYLSEICIKSQCWTQYTYSTYDFVSTVIPCPVAAPSSVTTVTGTDQSVLVSRVAETITNTHVTSTVIRKWKPTTVIQTLSTYTTLVKEWSAEYKDLGPLASQAMMAVGFAPSVGDRTDSNSNHSMCLSVPVLWTKRQSADNILKSGSLARRLA